MLHVMLQSDEGYRGNLSFKRTRLRRFTRLSPAIISISHVNSCERRRVEQFIERQYKDAYGAEIKSHYPTLMSVQESDGKILAAVGFRLASSEPLFLEQYLDQPIESSLSDIAGKAINRTQIVETGGLSSAAEGASIFLFIALNTYLNQQGYTHEVATITAKLQRYFSIVGMDMQYLGEASAARLAGEATPWGRYYDTQPKVYSGSISQAQSCMQRLLKLQLRDIEPHLYSRLHIQSTDIQQAIG